MWPRNQNCLGLFLDSPETFRAHFGWHNSLCIFKTKVSRSTELCSYFNFYFIYNKWKDQFYRINGSEFYEWLLGPETFSGLSRNEPPRVGRKDGLQRSMLFCSSLKLEKTRWNVWSLKCWCPYLLKQIRRCCYGSSVPQILLPLKSIHLVIFTWKLKQVFEKKRMKELLQKEI